MGREVRMVPADWQHPKSAKGYIPLFQGGFKEADVEWDEGYAKWLQGLQRCYGDAGPWKPIEERYERMTFSAYHGRRPDPCDYMPDWPQKERTHLMMYEDCSEGTPISPAFETPEALARWLVDNSASAFGGQPASYEGWLNVARGGWAPSMVVAGGVMTSGVEATKGHP